jgi:hypothetical protein
MSEGRLDPVAVREARGFVAHWLTLPTMTPEERDAIRIILAFLDEGREASAPFAVVVADYKKQTQVESDPDYPMLGRIGWEEDPPPQVRWRELDRLAAWSEAVSEPEGKNDGR